MKLRILIKIVMLWLIASSGYAATYTLWAANTPGGSTNRSYSTSASVKTIWYAYGKPPVLFASVGGANDTPGGGSAWIGPYSVSVGQYGGGAVICYGMAEVGGRIYGTMYGYSATYGASSGWLTGNAIAMALSSTFSTRPVAQWVDVTDYTIGGYCWAEDLQGWITETYKDSKGKTKTRQYWGVIQTGGISVTQGGYMTNPPTVVYPPAPLKPSGDLVLSKNVQRADADVLVSVSGLKAALEAFVARGDGIPADAQGETLTPVWGTTISSGSPLPPPVSQPTNFPSVSYFGLYAKDGNNVWYLLDYAALTPYGTMLDFAIQTPDSTDTADAPRTRIDVNAKVYMDMMMAEGILAPQGSTVSEDADLRIDVKLNAAGKDLYFNPGSTPITGVVATTTTGFIKATHTVEMVNSQLVTATGSPVTTQPQVVTFTPWSREISGATSKFPGLQLRPSQGLTIYPLASWTATGFLVSDTDSPISLSGAQNAVTTVPDDVAFSSSVTFTVANPYPESKFYIFMLTPSGSWYVIGSGAGSGASVDVSGSPDTALQEDGTYKMLVLAETPVDKAGIASFGPPETTVIPRGVGFGWMRLAEISFKYVNPKVVINGALSTAN